MLPLLSIASFSDYLKGSFSEMFDIATSCSPVGNSNADDAQGYICTRAVEASAVVQKFARCADNFD
jgi:hypothetical protein